jgi:plastocyanin
VNNMNRIVIIGVIVLVILGLGGFMLSRSMGSSKVNASTQGTSIQNGTTVQVTSNGFSPTNLTIRAGTTVTWVNNSGVDISVNSNNHPTHLLYPPLNLGRVSGGGSVSLRFDTPGVYGYHNHLNPSQMGTITVK